MALFARQNRMAPGEGEIRPVVIERGILPVVRSVAGGAIGSKTPAMFVVALVAGKTICWCAFENIVRVTFFASNFGMFTFQFEYRKVVIEGGIFPVRQVVTYRAVGAEISCVRVVAEVAGVTIQGRVFKISQHSRVGVALRTNQTVMTAGQREFRHVNEFFSEAIHTIVAGEAVITEFDGMSEGKRRFQVGVTIPAHEDVKRGNISTMAVVAGEGVIR